MMEHVETIEIQSVMENIGPGSYFFSNKCFLNRSYFVVLFLNYMFLPFFDGLRKDKI